jgi:hypothetical protein
VFRPLRHDNAPVIVYVTSTPLGFLCSKINKLGQEKPVFHPSTNEHPAHVVLKTNYSPYMEKQIDQLIKQGVLLELCVESNGLTQNHDLGVEINF